MKWITPERLFVCLNKHTPTHTQTLNDIYARGSSPPPDIAAIRDKHLSYRYELGEKGITWAAGALSGGAASGVPYALAIYSVNSLEETKQAQENDPYYLNRMSLPEKYFEWFIHMPIGRASPGHKDKLEQGLVEAGIKLPRRHSNVEWTTPERLFVCLSKQTAAHGQRLVQTYDKGSPLSAEAQALRYEHLCYVYDLGERGILWAGGPSADYSTSLSIFAVNSIEEAKQVKQNDPYYLKGMFYDAQYFEWTIHMPIDRASPGHKDRLKRDLARLGVLPG